MSGPLRILVVDDSAVVRQTFLRLLTAHGGMEVTVAADPLFALAKMRRERPDVIVLDLDLPRMDGLSFLARIMADDPLPVVICSAIAADRSDAAIAALELGALEIVLKPRVGVRDFLEGSAGILVDAVLAAAAARPRVHHGTPVGKAGLHPVPRLGRRNDARAAPLRSSARLPAPVVAMAASTGGTEALLRVLSGWPSDGPPAVVVQHMPSGFTAAFARRLDQVCAAHVREAAEGDLLERGVALIAPGNRHLVLARSGARFVTVLEDGPLVGHHRPSADVLFASVARAAGAGAIGVILTGMGGDGGAGLLGLRAAGAATLAQDEASCVVFGMPKEAIARGAVEEVVPLDDLADAILRRASQAGRGG